MTGSRKRFEVYLLGEKGFVSGIANKYRMNMKCVAFGLVGIMYGLLCTGCATDHAQSPEKMIVNTWKLTEFTPAPQFPMPDSVKQEIIARTVIEFTAGKAFTQTGIGRTHTGSYEISKDGTRITYYHDRKDVAFTETVLELTPRRMSVVDQNGNRMVRTAFKGDEH